MSAKDFLKSGALGIVPALVADNPKLLQGFGLAGNMTYRGLKDREEEKTRRAATAAGSPAIKAPTVGMKKGGSVKSSASKRADGIAQRGKTKGRFV
jgi:hypothetical protein